MWLQVKQRWPAYIIRSLIGCLILTMLSFASCARKLDSSDLVGKYRADYPFGVETLTLNSDGTYLQEFVEHQATNVLSASGKWTYDSRYRELVLQNPLVIDDSIVEPKQRATRVSGIATPWVESKTRILLNPDLGYYYRRQTER